MVQMLEASTKSVTIRGLVKQTHLDKDERERKALFKMTPLATKKVVAPPPHQEPQELVLLDEDAPPPIF